MPLRKYYKSTFPKWFSSKLKSLLFKKKVAHKNFKFTGNSNYYYQFSQFRSMCKAESKSPLRTYFKNVQENLKFDSRKF